jgi:Ca2+-binding RTX toxin-like protein
MTIAGETLAVVPSSINFRGGKKGIEANGDTKSNLLSGNDLIIGDGAKNQLSGMAGNDRIFGKQGNDRLSGGAGNDQMDGGKGNDVLEDSSGNDVLKGGVGSDRLMAGGGADILVGGDGFDLLTGGAGADLFVLSMGKQNSDIVTDFNVQEDLLDLRQVAVGRSPGLTPLAWFRQSIRLEQVGANTIVKLDQGGSGTMLNPLVTLNNVSVAAIEARNFVVS